jgi:diacylglycerol kinase (ATP)
MSKEKEPFTFKKRGNSFLYAFAGIKTLLKSEHNTWIHLAATIVAVVAGFIFHISLNSWFMLVVAISLVWITEALNTAVEFIVDMASPDFHPLAMKAKDVAAAAVLIASITAIMIGILIIINECKIY